VSDAELIELARNGDRAAFGDLVERYQHVVFRAAIAALRSREDAEEVTQEAMVSAFQKLDSFRGDASFKTWLLTITWNRAMDRRRRAASWFRRFVIRDREDGFELPSGQPSHEATLIAEETRREVRRLLGTLPAKYKEALLLSASGDHTFEEIGQLLRIPTGTAKWRAMEGRRILKKKLMSRGYAGTVSQEDRAGPRTASEPGPRRAESDRLKSES
jgi:RNA polymerase sigma-70 factor, ECF subfamily